MGRNAALTHQIDTSDFQNGRGLYAPDSQAISVAISTTTPTNENLGAVFSRTEAERHDDDNTYRYA
jgi:hypothetical protein